MENKIKPIGYIKTDFKEKFGAPRQSGRIKSALGKIYFEKEFCDVNAFRGIEEFSHLWLIFDFSLCHTQEFSPTVRPPRLGGNKRVGVFATRSPFRPNSLGLSCVKFEGIESVNGQIIITVSGVDVIDGTPIYDIKPYLPYADCILSASGSFAEENKNHRLKVEFGDELKKKFDCEKIDTLIDILSDDPRPSYIDDDKRIYTFNYANFEISFRVKDNILIVTDIT